MDGESEVLLNFVFLDPLYTKFTVVLHCFRTTSLVAV
jgi:hypothetical protein